MARGNITPVGEYILVELVSPEIEKSKGGIFMPVSEQQKKDKEAIIRAVGPKVEARDFKVGDYIVLNDFDVKKIPTEDAEFGLLRASSVFATYEHI